MRSRKHEAGFSLIELLIVVAIILVIAAIAIPNFLRSRIVANEASAVASLKSIATAQTNYASTYPNLGFADNLTKLRMPAPGAPPSPTQAGFLDWVLGCSAQPCKKSGYNFSVVDVEGDPITNYRILAVPVEANVTGRRGFCADQIGSIKYDPDGGSTCTQALQ